MPLGIVVESYHIGCRVKRSSSDTLRCMDLPGPLLASGRDADVFAYREGLVLRRYRRAQGTSREAAVMEHARGHGFPVPMVLEANETDIVMERVGGPTMLGDIARRPWRLLHHARTLADLHRRLHRIPAPGWLTDSLDGGQDLVHLDLHPENVLVSADGPMVIDWANARLGHGATDVALTWIIAGCSSPEGSPLDRWAARIGRGWFLRAFLAGFDPEALRQALPAAASFRLADRNVRGEERRQVEVFLRKRADKPGFGLMGRG
jgi:aminoglycoside phosphotransferase (APT) family kinase protein